MRGRWWLGLLVMGCAMEANEDDPQPLGPTVGPYEATIRWTEHGVPHVQADDHGSLAYGMGYAFARDHACVLADRITEVNSRRARHLGPGPDEAWIDRDFGWLHLGVRRTAEEAFPELEPVFQEAIVGYAAGYNRWLDEGTLPEACAGASWVEPIDHLDLLTWLVALTLDGSGAVWVEEVGRAQPPATARLAEPPGIEVLERVGDWLRDPRRGSNGWAIGRDRSTSGGGLLLSNTHFPNRGEKQWHESHLTIPGELDVYGASLMGVPLINLGFNRHVAWTHTVSFAPRFTGYFLSLDPEDPTRYVFGDETLDMESTAYTIDVLQGDEVVPRERTLWRTRFGPVIDAPLVGWSPTLAITFRDANAGNLQTLDVWHGMNKATSLDELIAVHRESQGIPWVYTIAADATGEVFFGDTSRVPNLSEAALDGWEAAVARGDLLPSTFADFGVIGLDGSDPANDWVEDPTTAAPGIAPLDRAPTDRRTDYVFNANDSHWLTNASAPLTGFETRLWGPERTPRSGRTRMNARLLEETGAGTASGEDGTFTFDEVREAALSMRSVFSEEALDAVVARCTGVTGVPYADDEVDVSGACDVLAAWDGRYRTDSVGAVLWREFLASAPFDVGGLNADGGGLFATPFDPDDPLGTPTDVVAATGDPATDPVLQALAAAVQTVDDAGWAVDVALGDVQFMPFADGGEEPVPGANYWEGTIGIADWSNGGNNTLLPYPAQGTLVDGVTGRTSDGYPMNNGNSWILVVELTDDGPQAEAVMTYSQSEDPASPFLRDQSPLYADHALRPVWFEEADVAAHTQEEVTLTLDAP